MDGLDAGVPDLHGIRVGTEWAIVVLDSASHPVTPYGLLAVLTPPGTRYHLKTLLTYY